MAFGIRNLLKARLQKVASLIHKVGGTAKYNIVYGYWLRLEPSVLCRPFGSSQVVNRAPFLARLSVQLIRCGTEDGVTTSSLGKRVLAGVTYPSSILVWVSGS